MYGVAAPPRLPAGGAPGSRAVSGWYRSTTPRATVGRAHRYRTRIARRQGFRSAVCGRDQGPESAGLFKDTLVICGSEFGRTPVVEWRGSDRIQNGRDHNPFGFTMWLAGGGVKGGMVYGATDEFGFKAVRKAVHVHDLHATILHLMGIDHTRLTYRYSGRDFRLTDVSGVW